MELSIIIIDDTELDHFIAKKVIANTRKTVRIKNFLDASLAFEYILTDDIDPGIKIILVFLDIYMPVMNGFQFVEEFEKLDQATQDKYYIVALTSSKEISDINRINSYRSFRAMINKPITPEHISALFDKITKELGIELL